jgi:Putative ATPase subunit of terminase (gpP-like)
MPKPQIDTKGRSQLTRHRMPDEADEWDDFGRHSLVRTPSPAGLRAKADTVTMQKRRALTQRALSLYAGGMRVVDIAAELGVTPVTITAWFLRHKQELEVNEIDDRLDKIAVPLAVDNLILGIMAGDKDYTRMALEGRGKLRKHTQGEAMAPSDPPVLRIEFVQPLQDSAAHMGTGAETAKVVTGVVVGRPMAAQKALGPGTPTPEPQVVGVPLRTSSEKET